MASWMYERSDDMLLHRPAYCSFSIESPRRCKCVAPPALKLAGVNKYGSIPRSSRAYRNSCTNFVRPPGITKACRPRLFKKCWAQRMTTRLCKTAAWTRPIALIFLAPRMVTIIRNTLVDVHGMQGRKNADASIPRVATTPKTC